MLCVTESSFIFPKKMLKVLGATHFNFKQTMNLEFSHAKKLSIKACIFLDTHLKLENAEIF